MEVQELGPGLWRWSARRGDADVWCVYCETAAATVLIDPVIPAERERFLRALDRDVERRGLPLAILCTTPAHAAEAAELVDRYAATLFEL